MTTKDRSYKIRETVPVGANVKFDEGTFFKGPIPAGTVGRIRSYANAGFSGILACVEIGPEGCTQRVSVSAGILSPV